jgi:hypothetical protein
MSKASLNFLHYIHLKKLGRRPVNPTGEQLVEECEKIDEMEEGQKSWVEMEHELTQKQQLKERVQEALKTMKETGRDQINLTDPDCAIMHSIQGSHASYNVQSVVDDKHGLIVHAEAVSETSDVNQFAPQIDQANDVLGKPCEAACADAGYADTEELQKIDAKGIKVVVPSQRHRRREEWEPHQPFVMVFTIVHKSFSVFLRLGFNRCTSLSLVNRSTISLMMHLMVTTMLMMFRMGFVSAQLLVVMQLFFKSLNVLGNAAAFFGGWHSLLTLQARQ